jgi:hypothetical protein
MDVVELAPRLYFIRLRIGHVGGAEGPPSVGLPAEIKEPARILFRSS